MKKATILGVGTELTTGQIYNKNAAWISEKLIPFGLETALQLTIPDDRPAILKALDYCAQNSQYIFVTGGLGPTSDDFTRELISEWSKKELKFDEISWQSIVVRMNSRNLAVKEIQKQQCYFPEGAVILNNSQGTAHGFQMEVVTAYGLKDVFILPGPPSEIEAIWSESIAKWLFVETQLFDKKITKAWDTLGAPESEVAALTELCLEGRWPDLKFDVGYRVHHPYVEVKFTYYKSQENLAKSIVEKIDKALENITVLKNFTDITQAFSKLTSKTEFAFYDFVTAGFLNHRLSSELKKYKNWMWKQSTQPLDTDFFTHEENFMALFPQDENLERAVVMGSLNGHSFTQELTATSSSPLMIERRKQYFAEMALITFVKQVK
ncbi:MAG: competence/damage-inducible protein A [Bdellovibrionota bacterium]